MTTPIVHTTKDDALGALDAEFGELDRLLASLSAGDLGAPLFDEGPGWRLRDVPAHVAWWKRLATAAAAKVLAGAEPPAGKLRAFLGWEPGDIDELNAEHHALWRDRTFAEAMDEHRRAHGLLGAVLAELLPTALLDPVGPEGCRRYWWQPGINHPRQHRAHILDALKARGPHDERVARGVGDFSGGVP